VSTEPSGVDLACLALQNARAAAKVQVRSARIVSAPRTARRGGRDPVGLSGALHDLVRSRAWEVPAAGGTVLDRWTDIARELAVHIAAVGFDASCGRLDLRPTSAAYATQARLASAGLIAQANTELGGTIVRSIRVLPPGQPPVPTGPGCAGPVRGPARTDHAPDPGGASAPAAAEVGSADYRRMRQQLRAERERRAAEALRGQQAPPAPAASLREPQSAFIRTLHAEDQDRAPALAVHQRALVRARAERLDARPATPQR